MELSSVRDRWRPQITADGSLTFYSPEFGETFHSQFGAKQEAEQKFVVPTQLAQRATQPEIHLLDVCYGLGYNSAAALETIWRVNPHCRVTLIALELEVEIPQAAILQGGLQGFDPQVQAVLTELAVQQQVRSRHLHATLYLGDARQSIQQLDSSFQADAVFLDPFSPPHCPQLWTVEFLAQVAQFLKPQGRLATYSCAASVRSALLMAGLQIGATPPVGRRSPGTVASFQSADLPELSIQEQEHLQTKAAIPYRDPTGSDSAVMILNRRQAEQQTSSLEPTSHWKKRWQP